MIHFGPGSELPVMSSYRKKPLIIEARKMVDPFSVETLEGTMRGKAGDYLVKGIRGEIYPVNSEIFKETYEVVT